jgi:hypothetical protein
MRLVFIWFVAQRLALPPGQGIVVEGEIAWLMQVGQRRLVGSII